MVPNRGNRADVHFLGGLRHFYNWEIADIGVLIFAKKAGTVVANTVAVLQSKRLYPDQGTVMVLARGRRVSRLTLVDCST